ncbi:MAG: hypothetical protein IPH00_16120 [Flavobacteriales bacterium]|nr:hypothetical protein [Flavobacteriales bacterium]
MDAITQIEALRESVLEVLTEIDKLSETLRGHQASLFPTMAQAPDSNVVTPSGKIRGLQNKVLTLLKRNAEPLSSDEIARRLFQPEYGVSFDAFKRRIIVTTSYLHKTKGKLELISAGDGTQLWNNVGRDYKDSWDGMLTFNDSVVASIRETLILQSKGFDIVEKKKGGEPPSHKSNVQTP